MKLLFLAPHCDDEISSIGIISKAMEKGYGSYFAVFSFTEINNITEPEFDDCMKILGVPENNVFKFNYPTRHFPQYRQAILEELVRMNEKLAPELVLIPNSRDIHQDHHTIHLEGLRAFARQSVLGYESPKHLILDDKVMLVELDDRLFKKKMDCMACYKSQASRWGTDYWLNREPLARVRGMQAGCKYAEGFEMIKIII